MNYKNIVIKTIKWGFISLVVLVLAIAFFMNFHPVFGEVSDENSQKKIIQSPHFNGEKFVNLVPTGVMINQQTEENRSMWSFFFPAKGKNPDKPIPTFKFDKEMIKDDTVTWMGHSTILIRTGSINIIFDPVFYRASPIPFVGIPFEFEHPIKINDLPNIDVVIISHDHYDHLDYKTIKELSPQVKKFFVPLGVKAHLLKWGVENDKIVELDWYENTTVNSIDFTLTPSRHFSGRGLTNRDSTLWGSWIIKSESMNLYFSGDTGYFDEFKKIGEKYGPFDIAFIENGAYDVQWADIHLMPEETVQASIDLKAKIVFPIHWSKFDLAYHPWYEPAVRIIKEAEKKGVDVATPLIGQTFVLESIPKEKWWEILIGGIIK